MTFSNLSTPIYGTTAYTWTFGDGATSTLTNPVHCYTSTGNYTVALITALATAAVTETDTLTRTGYITVTSGGCVTPTAGFSATPLTGTVPLTVTFTDSTTGDATSYLWDYGDGITGTASTVTHTHTYTAADVYTVSLTVSGTCGSDVLTRTHYITVTAASAFSTTVITYTYDALSRLTKAEYDDGSLLQYTYDAVGNATVVVEYITSTVTTTYSYNAASQLVTATSSADSTVWWYTF